MDPNQNPNPVAPPPEPQNPAPEPPLAVAPELTPTPAPVPQPIASPPPTAPVVSPAQPPTQPQTQSPIDGAPQPSATPATPTVQAQGPMTQADFLKLAKKQRAPKKFLAIFGGLVLLVGIYFTLNTLGLLPWASFKTVEYVNGKGDTYSLKFYAKNTIEPVANNDKWKALVSKQGKGGKAPIRLEMYDIPAKSDSTGFTNSQVCGGKTPIMTVHNKSANTDVKVCDLSETSSDLPSYIYFATFKNGNKATVMLIMNDLDFETGLKDPKSAKELVKKTGLDTYNDDIKTILASIKTVNK